MCPTYSLMVEGSLRMQRRGGNDKTNEGAILVIF